MSTGSRCATISAAAGPEAAAGDLRAHLARYADRLAVGRPSCLGSRSNTFARLAAADGDPVEAWSHALAALAVHREPDLALWTARAADLPAGLPT